MVAKLALTRHIASIYAQGENIMQHLRGLGPAGDQVENALEDILISYDFQAGTYIANYERDPTHLERYTDEIASVFAQLGAVGTVLEAGCGEATTLGVLGPKLPGLPDLGGFDLSWSRVKLGSEFAARRGLSPTLFCGDLFQLPLADRSVDVVYTSHSIEPNGGREREAISSLARIARRWLVLLEPAHDLADAAARQRMEDHGYVRNLAATIRDLGLELVEHRLLPVCSNPLNPTGLYLVRIDAGPEDTAPESAGSRGFHFRCPVSGAPLTPGESAYYAPESFLAYPVLDGIPCLLEGNAILATKYRPAGPGTGPR